MDIKKLQKLLAAVIYKRATGEISKSALDITYAAILETAKSGGFTKQELFDGLPNGQ
jgi:hypothetical protein